METYDKWTLVYEDDKIDTRRNPRDPEEYGLNIKGTEELLILSRGSLREIVKGNREKGKSFLFTKVREQRLGFDYFCLGTHSLTLDSMLSALLYTHIIEEERKELRDYFPKTKKYKSKHRYRKISKLL